MGAFGRTRPRPRGCCARRWRRGASGRWTRRPGRSWCATCPIGH